MKPVIHAIAGTAAMLTIVTFWTSTLVSEVFLDHTAVAAVKHSIVYGLFLLVPFMAATGSSGFVLSKTRKGLLLDQKKKRMAVIGANGVLVMIPAALFLNGKAAAGEFDAFFYAVQVVELVIGIVQLTLMGMNFRDGLKLSGKSVNGLA
jgi:TM2 domain-containing membrane protein YozV